MAASDSLRIVPLPMRSLGFASVGAGYTAIGTASTDSSRILLVQNLTDKLVIISHDGVTDHYPLAAQGALIFDLTTNRTADASGAYIASGTRIYCKHSGVAPTSGSVYVTFFVGRNNS